MRRNRDFIGPAGMGGLVSLWGASSLIQSVQRGTIVIAALGTTNTATITAVNLANTRLVYDGHTCVTNNVTAAIGNAYVQLTNATTLTATRNTASTDTVTVAYEVLEYAPGIVKSVQRGTVVNGTPATITAVNTAKSELDYLGFISTNTVPNNNQTTINPYLVLTNATTVTGEQALVSSSTSSYQVTEFF